MTDIILIVDTVLIFIILLYELFVLLTGKKRMEYLIKREILHDKRINEVRDYANGLEHRIIQLELQIKKWE